MIDPKIGERWFIRDGIDMVHNCIVLGITDSEEYIVEYWDYPTNCKRVKRRNQFLSPVPVPVVKPKGFWATVKRILFTDD